MDSKPDLVQFAYLWSKHSNKKYRMSYWVKNHNPIICWLTGSKLGKEYKAAYCRPAYLTSLQSTSSKMLG